MKKVVFPGSFDPITLGHVELIERSSLIFDEVVVLVVDSGNNHFDLDVRIMFVKKVVSSSTNVEVKGMSGLLTDWLKRNDVDLILRGVRNFRDMDQELDYISALKMIDTNVESLLMIGSPALRAVSSTRVRELMQFDCDLSGFLNSEIIELVRYANEVINNKE